MSFNSNLGKVVYTITNGNIVDYTYNFQIYNEPELGVYLVDELNQSIKLTLNVDYSVIINGDTGGYITLSTNPTENNTLILIRELPYDRNYDYVSNSTIYADTLNDDQNYQTYLIADGIGVIAEDSIKVPPSAINVDTVLEHPIPNTYLKWNEQGTKIINDEELLPFLEAILLLLEEFKGVYYGALPEEPSTDPVGKPINIGDIYYDTTLKALMVYSEDGWISAPQGPQGPRGEKGNDGIDGIFTTIETPMDIKEYYALNGQTDFSVKYGYNKLEVFLNGLCLNNIDNFCNIDDYVLTSTGITLSQPTQIDDIVKLIGYDYQGTVNGALFPMNTLFPGDFLYPSNEGCVTAVNPQQPHSITDFTGSTNQFDAIQFKWTIYPTYPATSYDLFDINNVLIASNITTGYTYITNGFLSTDFYVLAFNSIGVVSSNSAEGTSIDSADIKAPSRPTNMSASDDLYSKIKITFDNGIGVPIPTHDLYENNVLVASNILSGYEFYVSPSVNKSYYVKALNSVGSANSFADIGGALPSPIVADQCLPPADSLFPSDDTTDVLFPKQCLPDGGPKDFVLEVTKIDSARNIFFRWERTSGAEPITYAIYYTNGLIYGDTEKIEPGDADYCYYSVNAGPEYDYWVIATNVDGSQRSNTVRA